MVIITNSNVPIVLVSTLTPQRPTVCTQDKKPQFLKESVQTTHTEFPSYCPFWGRSRPQEDRIRNINLLMPLSLRVPSAGV